MHTLRFALLCTLALCTACNQQSNAKSSTSYEDGIAAIQKAQDDADRVHLGEKLTDAGTNLKKLSLVYLDATRLGVSAIATKADTAMEQIVLQKTREDHSRFIIEKYLKRVPEGSKTHKILALMLKNET